MTTSNIDYYLRIPNTIKPNQLPSEHFLCHEYKYEYKSISLYYTAQKMKKSLMENFIFCAVLGQTMLDDRKTISVLLQGKFTLYCLSQMFYKKDILKKFMRPATFLKKRLRHWCFYENVRKFLRTPFFIEHIHLQLLKIYLWKYDS